jgi:hypothetical protein
VTGVRPVRVVTDRAATYPMVLEELLPGAPHHSGRPAPIRASVQPAQCQSGETKRMGNVAASPTAGRDTLGREGGLGRARTVGITLVGGGRCPGSAHGRALFTTRSKRLARYSGPRIGDVGLRGQPVAEQRPGGPDRVMNVVAVVDIGEHGDEL